MSSSGMEIYKAQQMSNELVPSRKNKILESQGDLRCHSKLNALGTLP